MRILFVFALALALVGCGGGGDNSTLPPVPNASIEGVVAGPLVNGTVRVYDYTTGTKGAQLGSATTDTAGRYSITFNVEGRPILVEATGGSYNELAGPRRSVALAGPTLKAVGFFSTGAKVTLAITPFTHVAAALAANSIQKGVVVGDSIVNANNRVSAIFGVTITATQPADVADTSSASAVLTPELKYGFLIASLSQWAYTNAPSPAVAQAVPFTSINLAQTMYSDVVADGRLDGKGVDSSGAELALSYGTVPLTASAYRTDLPLAMLDFVASANNRTGLSGSALFTYSQAISQSAEALFGDGHPIEIAKPVVDVVLPNSGAFLSRTSVVTVDIKSLTSILTADLLVNNNVIATIGNTKTPTFNLDTTAFADGVYTIGVRATDSGAQTVTTSIPVTVDNTAPSSSPCCNGQQSLTLTSGVAYFTGTAGDGLSGVYSVKNLANGNTVFPPASGVWAVRVGTTAEITAGLLGNFWQQQIEVRDRAGNCSKYDSWGGGVAGPWRLLETGYAC